MKKIQFILAFLFSTLSFSQSESLIDVTWICTDIVINGDTIQAPNNDEVTYVVLEMIDDANPDTVNFTTNVCNTLSSSHSSVVYNDPESSFIIPELAQTLILCAYSQNQSFEMSYFNFFYGNINSSLFYNINNNNEVTSLTITAPNGDIANYEKFILKIDENTLSEIEIYPNPTTEVININPKIDTISKIEIYSISGQIIKSINNPNFTIDVSDFSKGLYFLKIYDTENFTTKRFVKN